MQQKTDDECFLEEETTEQKKETIRKMREVNARTRNTRWLKIWPSISALLLLNCYFGNGGRSMDDE